MAQFLQTQQVAAHLTVPCVSFEQRAEAIAVRRSRTRTSRANPPARRSNLVSLAKAAKLALVDKLGLEVFENPLYLFSRRGTGIQNTEKAYKKHWKGKTFRF